jgi:hypothetical protein
VATDRKSATFENTFDVLKEPFEPVDPDEARIEVAASG